MTHRKITRLVPVCTIGALLLATSAQGGTPRRNDAALKGRGMSVLSQRAAPLAREPDWSAFMKQTYPGRTYRTGLPNVSAGASFYAATGALYDGGKKVLSYAFQVNHADVVDNELMFTNRIGSDRVFNGVSLQLDDFSPDHAYVVQCPVKLLRRDSNTYARVEVEALDHLKRPTSLHHVMLKKSNVKEYVTFVVDPTQDNARNIKYSANLRFKVIVVSRQPTSVVMSATSTCTIRALKRLSS